MLPGTVGMGRSDHLVVDSLAPVEAAGQAADVERVLAGREYPVGGIVQPYPVRQVPAEVRQAADEAGGEGGRRPPLFRLRISWREIMLATHAMRAFCWMIHMLTY